ncbi:GNAT family N-acetyltransferase [Streptomyces pseudogriseolus]|uniref:GNAT family N-acetyltransferase n=1 Tax=Streptomyces pseudogriseolus TaxID=36817 RepID=UPI003FA227F6
MSDLFDRLTTAAPAIAEALDGTWTVTPTPPDSDPVTARSVLLHDASRDVTVRLHIDDYVDGGKLIADGQLPDTPDDVLPTEALPTFLNTGHCGMTPRKLDKPEQVARAINRRLLPVLAEAYELWQTNVAAARAKETRRRRAADLLATLPGMDSPRRNSYATSRQRALLLGWDGSPRVPDARPGSRHEPRARVTVDATEDLKTVTVELSHLSAEAAYAAVRAAIEASSDTLRTEYTENADGASFTLSLHLGSQLVAYADTAPYPNVWSEGRWLYEIAVHPAFRGFGYGTRMLHAVRAQWPDEPLSFTPEAFTPHIKGWEARGLSDEQLVAWYTRHGARPTPTKAHPDALTIG